MKRYTASMLTSILGICVAQAQTTEGVYEVPMTLSELAVEPSPEPAAMKRYSDLPVSHATGTAVVAVPLAEWQVGRIPVSLSLRYHTGGIRNDDLAGFLGLGWSLDGLGAVSRTVMTMPDESKTAPFVTPSGNPTLSHIMSLRELRADTDHDRYRYSLPGYSGSFIISDGSVIQLPATDLDISFTADTSNPKAIASFSITTPTGIRYTFAARETVEYSYTPNPQPMPWYSHDYTATSSWLLTAISDCEGGETVSVTYTDAPSWSRNHDRNLDSEAYRWGRGNNGFVSGGPSGLGSMSRSTFTGQKIPSRITSRTATVDFTVSSMPVTGQPGPTRRITNMTVKDYLARTVRTVAFDNSGRHSDGRMRLSSVSISDGGVLVDKRTFSYYDGRGNSGHSDPFGYANNITTPASDGVLDRDGQPSAARGYSAVGARGLSLHTIEESGGAVTTLDYEPSVREAAGKLREIKAGIRLRRITVNDRMTGRKRVRDFSYSGAVPSAELSEVGLSAYIALSGVDTYNQGGGMLVSKEHTLSATMTATSRLPGFPIENTAIYYGEVTETVSGTGLDHPVKTVYRYDCSHCLHEAVRDGNAPGLGVESSGYSRYLGCDAVYTNGTAAQNAKAQRLFSAKNVNLYFREYIGTGPVEVSRTEYEWRDGDYRPLLTERRHYEEVNSRQVTVGLYHESLVYKTVDISMQTRHGIESLNDINCFAIKVRASRMLCDSVTVERHYPGGHVRKESTHIINNSIIAVPLDSLPELPLFPKAPPLIHFKSVHPGFSDDTVKINTMSFPRMLGMRSACGTDTMSVYYCDSEMISTAFFKSATSRGLRRLPVITRWVNPEGSRIDMANCYSQFTNNARTYTRPSVEALRTAPDHTVAQRLYRSYSTFGHPASVTDADGTDITLQWGHDGDCLTGRTLAGVSLSTSYVHSPLVGVTKITYPSGRTRSFTYSGGRLSKELNSAGAIVRTVDYGIYSDGGVNRVSVSAETAGGTVTTTSLIDGFGMPVRSITRGGASGIMTAMTYDALDRPVKEYRPVARTSDTYLDESGVLAAAVSAYGDSRPFTESGYGHSRDTRPEFTITAGAAYLDHPARIRYRCNTTAAPYDCRRYRISADRSRVTLDGLYQAGMLDVTESTDPDGHVTLTFTDWLGHTVLTRVVLPGGNLDTYSINDGWGKPHVVLQPDGSARFSATGTSRVVDNDPVLLDYAFIYRYDKCLRVVEERVPGGGTTRYGYDMHGRPAWMQDGNLMASGRYMFTLYDKASRVAVTGTCTSAPSSTVSMTATYSGVSSGLCNTGYTTGVTLPGARILTVNFYDSYDFISMPQFGDFSRKGSNANSKGMMTGMLARVLDSADAAGGTERYAATVYRYDTEGRVLSVVASNGYPSVCHDATVSYAIDGQPLMVKEDYTFDTNKGYSNYRTHSYDAMGRLASVKGEFQDSSADMVALEYDAAGQVSRATYSKTAVDYGYTVAGLPRTMSGAGIAQTLYRADGTTPLYNGDISRITETPLSPEATALDVTCSYDGAGRLTGVSGTEGSTVKGTVSHGEEYVYDRNSNITSLTRWGRTGPGDSYGIVDDLTMEYSGNRLLRVSDTADEVLLEGSLDFTDGADHAGEYGYDDCGNVIRDDNRGITRLEYNELGLPAVIEFDSGDRLEYAYDATGRKLSVELVPAPDSDAPAALPMALPGALTAGGTLRSAVAEKRDYYGAYELKNGSIDRINTPWGYFRGGYHAYIRDRQGSVRAVLNAKNGDQTVQRARYYPGGLPTHTPAGLDVNRYLHTSKELDTRLGLTLYDFETRLYDPQLGRFLSPDPMAGSYTPFSPYTFCAANPLRYSDPTGMRLEYDIEDINKKEELIKTVNDLCQGSALFNIMHGLLEKSETTFVVRFGETIKAEDGHLVSGLYDSQNKSITFNQNYEPPHARVLTEEYYHAYQDDYRYLNGGEWNREFEAKVMTSCMLNGPNVGFVKFDHMEEFSYDLYSNPFMLLDYNFKIMYLKEGKSFAESYRSNPNYGYPVKFLPFTLIKIVDSINIVELWKDLKRL